MLNQLKQRKGLSQDDDDYREYLQKGFEGERKFDEILERLSKDSLIIQDLRLEANRQTFQIDTLVITGNNLLVYEIKNFHGEYTFHDNELKTPPYKRVIMNPLTQLNRCGTLLNILLDKIGASISVNRKLVFVNDSFVLYQKTEHPDILLPQQIERHISHLNSFSVPVNSLQRELGYKLLQLHQTEDRYIQVPEYTFEELKKEIMCPQCRLNLKTKNRRTAYCPACGFSALNTRIISEEVQAFVLLFPDQKLTTAVIYDWCGALFPKRTIQRVLATNYTESGTRKGTHYLHNSFCR